ncbi:hypothetical protein [Lysobacter xanthus]
MIRRLLLPLAASALLAGCVTTAPYGYRGDGQGDYYYGAPSVEYRYHGTYPGYGYPYSGPYRPGLSVWGSYGYPGYGYPGYGPYYGGSRYGYPYYGSPYGYPYGYPRPVYRPRPSNPGPGPGTNLPPPGDTTTGRRPDGGPWRNVDEIARRRRAIEGGGNSGPSPSAPIVARPDFGGMAAPRPMPRGDGEGGRRARSSSEQDE